MWPFERPAYWAGRRQELAALQAGIEALRRDEGAVIWVEGEPGIGKSSLVAEALAGVSEPGWDIGWGIADELTDRLPLRVMLDCLQVRPDSLDPRRAHAADLIRKQQLGLFSDGDAAVAGIEVLLMLADELCAAAPTIMVIDDLQWADDASLILRSAALLGGKFTVTDLTVLVRRPASDLAAGLQEAVAADLLVASGAELAFRHPLIRHALYESMSAAERTARHAEAARELAAAGADVLSVAQQLSAATPPGEGWAQTWLLQAAPTLTMRAPQLAADLLRRELDETPSVGGAWDGLTASLVRALLAAGSYEEAAGRASRALPIMTDPVRRAETYSVLARAQVGAGDYDAAISTAGRKPSWPCTRLVRPPCAAGAMTARPGPPRRCCGTGWASGTMRWSS